MARSRLGSDNRRLWLSWWSFSRPGPRWRGRPVRQLQCGEGRRRRKQAPQRPTRSQLARRSDLRGRLDSASSPRRWLREWATKSLLFVGTSTLCTAVANVAQFLSTARVRMDAARRPTDWHLQTALSQRMRLGVHHSTLSVQASSAGTVTRKHSFRSTPRLSLSAPFPQAHSGARILCLEAQLCGRAKAPALSRSAKSLKSAKGTR